MIIIAYQAHGNNIKKSKNIKFELFLKIFHTSNKLKYFTVVSKLLFHKLVFCGESARP